ncbi:MAG TPA: alkaline phosphatase family protein, partial [Anaerolineales bacterium]
SKGDVQVGQHVMDCFNPAMLPTLSTLVEQFCLCTAWFSSIPGPTWPNRFFVHAATSDGLVTNEPAHPYEMKTIYESLGEAGKTWTIYYGDIPVSLALRRLWGSLGHFKGFEKFKDDLSNESLANYSFIEPRYMDFLEWQSSDEHPPHDLKIGEYLMAEVYDLLRASPYWEKSLLVILYDEHGGFFEHVPPPEGVPNPDGKVSTDPPFDFTRLGLRVPALLVSPFIEKGIQDNTIYEHASVPATLKKLFDLPDYLTRRDRAANTFEGSLTRSTPRQDTPLTLPVPGDPQEASQRRLLFQKRPKIEELAENIERRRISTEPLSEFQGSLVDLANHLDAHLPGAAPAAGAASKVPQIEHEAAIHVEHILGRLMRR